MSSEKTSAQRSAGTFSFQDWFRSCLGDDSDRTLILLSILIGVVVGLTTVAFMLLTGRLAARMYPPESAAWRRLVVPVLGSLVSGYLLFRYFPNARGSGIPQTKFAIFLRDGYISLRTVLGKLACCSVSLASGIALGREGPSVQIGGGIASVIGRRFGLSPANVKALVPVGCSAALAAAFNTPIAAVLFSLEEILGDMHAPVLGSVVLSSATSWMVLHLLLGDDPLFHPPAYHLVHPVEFGIYALLGIAGGLGSVCFVKLLLQLRLWFRKLPKSTVWLQPAAGGLLVGALGWFVPGVLGVGYDFVDRVLGGDVSVKAVLLMAVLKMVATPFCYSSGNAGGIFGPSLFIGAMIGSAVGSGAHTLLPGLTAGPGAYALVGMGAAFAGIVRTPLTSVIMIFEMTRDYSIIVPLMIANLVSFFISRRLQPDPIYEALALQEGVHLPAGAAREEFSGILVGDILDRAAPLLPADAGFEQAKAFLFARACNSWPVGDEKFVQGMVAMQQIETAPAGASQVGDLMFGDSDYPHVHLDHAASQVLERMRGRGVDSMPVVSRTDVHELLGVVTLSGILAAYRMKAEAN
jgi:CIC family chloride channel protein